MRPCEISARIGRRRRSRCCCSRRHRQRGRHVHASLPGLVPARLGPGAHRGQARLPAGRAAVQEALRAPVPEARLPLPGGAAQKASQASAASPAAASASTATPADRHRRHAFDRLRPDPRRACRRRARLRLVLGPDGSRLRPLPDRHGDGPGHGGHLGASSGPGRLRPVRRGRRRGDLDVEHQRRHRLADRPGDEQGRRDDPGLADQFLRAGAIDELLLPDGHRLHARCRLGRTDRRVAGRRSGSGPGFPRTGPRS